jgi:class 3 adenylate cyclase
MATGRALTRFGDVCGPAVNRAARLMSLARPGAAGGCGARRGDAAEDSHRRQRRRLAAARRYDHLRSWALRPREQRLKPSPGPSHGAVIGTKSTALGGYVGSA